MTLEQSSGPRGSTAEVGGDVAVPAHASSSANGSAQGTPGAGSRGPRRRKGLGNEISRFSVPGALVVLVVAFSIAMPDTFFTWNNIQSIAGQQAVSGLMALALLPALIAGDFDLSLGAVLTTASVLVITLQVDAAALWPVAALAAIAVGVLIGIINSVLVVRIGMNSLIATLAVATTLGGIVQWITGGKVVYGNLPATFTKLGRWELFGIPGNLFYLIAIALLLWVVLTRTSYGRLLSATGSNAKAAKLSGVNTVGIRTVALMITGGLAGLAGVVFAANTGSGQPGIGDQFLLPAFAAAFLGATAFTPGRFNVWGTVTSVYLLAVGVAGLQQLGAPFYVEPIFNGLALIVAVAVATILRKGKQA